MPECDGDTIAVIIAADSKLEVLTPQPAALKARIYGRGWQVFDSLFPEERPFSVRTMLDRIESEVLADNDALFNDKPGNDLGNIGWGGEEDRKKMILENKAGNVKREIEVQSGTPTNSVIHSEQDIIIFRGVRNSPQGMKYLKNTDGTNTLWLVTDISDAKKYEYDFGALALRICTPEEYVAMMKQRRLEAIKPGSRPEARMPEQAERENHEKTAVADGKYGEIKNYIAALITNLGRDRDLEYEKKMCTDMEDIKHRYVELNSKLEIDEGDVLLVKGGLGKPRVVIKIVDDNCHLIEIDGGFLSQDFNFVIGNYIRLPKAELDKRAEGEGAEEQPAAMADMWDDPDQPAVPKITVVQRCSIKDAVFMETINFAVVGRNYTDAVENGETKRVDQAYLELITGIRAADSLDMVEPLQRLYLYLFSLPRVEGKLLAEEFGLEKIGEEILNRLRGLKIETEERIEAVLGMEVSDEEKDLLEKFQAKIARLDFTEPLRLYFGKGRRTIFKYTSGKLEKIIKILHENNLPGNIVEVEAISPRGNWPEQGWEWDEEGLADIIREILREHEKLKPDDRKELEREQIYSLLSGLKNLGAAKINGKYVIEVINDIFLNAPKITNEDEVVLLTGAKIYHAVFVLNNWHAVDEDKRQRCLRDLKELSWDTLYMGMIEKRLKPNPELLTTVKVGSGKDSMLLNEYIKKSMTTANWTLCSRFAFEVDRDSATETELVEYVLELQRRYGAATRIAEKKDYIDMLARLKNMDSVEIQGKSGYEFICGIFETMQAEQEKEIELRLAVGYARFRLINHRDLNGDAKTGEIIEGLIKKYQDMEMSEYSTYRKSKIIEVMSRVPNLAEIKIGNKSGYKFLKGFLGKEIKDADDSKLKAAALTGYIRASFINEPSGGESEKTYELVRKIDEGFSGLNIFEQTPNDLMMIYKNLSRYAKREIENENKDSYTYIVDFLKTMLEKQKAKIEGSSDAADEKTVAEAHYIIALKAYWELKLESCKQKPEPGNNEDLQNNGVFGVAIIGILPWLQEPAGAILALLAYWGVNMIIPAVKSRISKSALSRAEQGIKASDKFMKIIPAGIRYAPNANILKSHFWVFEQWPRLRLAIIGIMTAWPGSARLSLAAGQRVEHDLERRVLGSLPPNELALLDILKAESIEIRRLPENIGWGQYLIGLVGQKWMEREGAQIKISLPAQLCDEYEKTVGQADALPSRLVSQITAYMGERHYSEIYTNIYKAEGLLETVKTDPLLAQQFNLQTPTGRRLQNALEQLARGQTPETVQRLSWVVLRALTETKNQALEQRLLSLLEKADPQNSIKVEIRSVSGKKHHLRLPAVIFKEQSLFWRLNQKYPEGIEIIEDKKFKLPKIELRKYISQAA